jgi:hypothetical protein
MIHHISVDLKLTNAGAPYEAPFDAWLALELQRLSSCTLSSGRLWFVYWAIRRFTDNLFSLGHAWLSLWSKNMITGRINQFTWMFELPPFGHLVSIIKCCSRLVGGGTRDRLRIVFSHSNVSHLDFFAKVSCFFLVTFVYVSTRINGKVYCTPCYTTSTPFERTKSKELAIANSLLLMAYIVHSAPLLLLQWRRELIKSSL